MATIFLTVAECYVRHVLPKIFEADAKQAPVSPSFLSFNFESSWCFQDDSFKGCRAEAYLAGIIYWPWMGDISQPSSRELHTIHSALAPFITDELQTFMEILRHKHSNLSCIKSTKKI
jgi:hypothetical protein